MHRLTGADYPGADNDTYTYDAVGNRKTKTGVTGGYDYDAADRMTAAGGVSYGYDNNGNLTSRGSDSFAWNANDRMTSATVSSTTTTFAYNGDGQRDSRTTGGNTVTFTWDIAAGIPQVLDDGTFKYVHGLGRISEVGPGTTTHYYLPDGLGSTMGLVSSTGASVNTYNYDVFGAVRSSTGSQANEYQFAGEQVDSSTGLQYLRERYYDMATGRFLGQDRAEPSFLLSQELNRFAYVMNSPVNLVDPSGLTHEGSYRCRYIAHSELVGYDEEGNEVWDYWLEEVCDEWVPGPEHFEPTLETYVAGAVIVIAADATETVVIVSCVLSAGAACGAVIPVFEFVVLPAHAAALCLWGVIC